MSDFYKLNLNRKQNNKVKQSLFLILFFSFFILLQPSQVFAIATITIVNADGAGEGFNDATAFTAVVGNRATTLGQARLNALQHAANLLGSIITSAVDIKIQAKFNPLGGDASSATLGGANTAFVNRDFTGALFADTWYPIALAEKLLGANIIVTGGTHEIEITFNSDIDGTVVLLTRTFYYGMDSTPPGTDIDFITVALHELIHGIGFSSFVNVNTGEKLTGQNAVASNDAFMRLLEHHGVVPADYPTMNDTQRIAAAISDPLLHWLGATVSANLAAVTAGKTATHLHMYAPSPIEAGSSVSHFNVTVTPSEMMEPAYTTADHNIGLAAYLLTDIGWGTTKVNNTSSDIQVTQTDSGLVILSGSNETYNLVVSNNSAANATEVVVTNMMPAGATYVSGTPDSGSCFQSSNIVTCHIGDLTMATPINIAIVLRLNTVGTNTNSIYVDSVNPDSSKANNANFEATTVDPAPIPPPVPPPGGTKSCFIATAAYGTPMESEVRYLRAFRDQYLLTNTPGRWFVKMYYRYSPAMAATISESESLRSMIQTLLSPWVAMSQEVVSKNYLDRQQ